MVSYNASDCIGGLYSRFPLVEVGRFAEPCREFANSCSNNYQDRNQSDERWITEQGFVGKMGEFVAYESLRGLVDGLSEPDIVIYEVREKSFGWDMTGGGFNFAVKTFDTESPFPVSWTFQYADVGGFGRDKLIFDVAHGPNDYLVCVVMDAKKNEGRISSVVPLATIDKLTGYDFVSAHHWDIFENPKLAKLIGIKKCIYWRRLIDLKLVPELFEGSDRVCVGA